VIWRSAWRRAVTPIVAAMVAAVLAGAGYLAVRDGTGRADIGRWVAQQPPDRPTGSGGSHRLPAPRGSGPPTRLSVPAIGVYASLESLRLDSDGALTPPKEFDRPGWYADGTMPGEVGPAVIAGHVDSRRGPAVFHRLRELTAGDEIRVVRGGATVVFTVVGTAWYPKERFPTANVYGPTPDRQLRLITCGGGFDRTVRSYRDNLVVYAVTG
jgi:Sortase domain